MKGRVVRRLMLQGFRRWREGRYPAGQSVPQSVEFHHVDLFIFYPAEFHDMCDGLTPHTLSLA
jgi:hypothetical protein